MWREGDIVQDGGDLYIIDAVVYPPEGGPWVTVWPVDEHGTRLGWLPGASTRRYDVDALTFVRHHGTDRICMGRVNQWACFLPVAECECDVKCPRCPGERTSPGVWRCTCGEAWPTRYPEESHGVR